MAAKETTHKIRIKRGDTVKVIAGKNKGMEGKVLVVDKKKNRLIVEGVNMITKHQKQGRNNPQSGIVKKEAPIHVSNVMYVHNGKPTRIGIRLSTIEKDGKTIIVKQRIAKSTGDVID